MKGPDPCSGLLPSSTASRSRHYAFTSFDFKLTRGARGKAYRAPAKSNIVEVPEMKYRVSLEQSDEGYAASVIGLPGCHSQGATEQEAVENIADAIREYLEVAKELAQGATIREIEVEV